MSTIDWILVAVFAIYVIRVEYIAYRMGKSFGAANMNFTAIAQWMVTKDKAEIRKTFNGRAE